MIGDEEDVMTSMKVQHMDTIDDDAMDKDKMERETKRREEELMFEIMKILV